MAEHTSQQRASVPAAHRFHERVSAWKAKLADTRQRLRDEFFAREAPAELLRRHSAAIDRQLKEVWASQAMPRDAVLAAVGGYGRGQLFPSSDIDLLILLAAPADDKFARKLEDLVGILWDIGLEVGHSVRTVEECLSEVERAGCPLVEVTGGEPLLQASVYPLMTALCDRGYEVLLETSGALAIDRVDPRVRRIVDWKTPASAMESHNHRGVPGALKRGDELKLVIQDRRDYEWARDWCRRKRATISEPRSCRRHFRGGGLMVIYDMRRKPLRRMIYF